MRVCIVGADGMLGTDLMQVFGAENPVGFDLPDVDITDAASIREALAAAAPDVVINCAALTQVDDCETRRDVAFAVNGDGAGHVAAACREAGARLIQISTDYVFDGTATAPITEDAVPNPQGVYGASKLAGERAVAAALPGALIVRTAWLFGRHGPNFIETILRLAQERDRLTIVDDQRGVPTYTRDLAHGIMALCGSDAEGYVHLTNAGSCTWCDYARFILEQAHVENVTVVPISTAELGRPAPRPAYSVLDGTRFAALTGAPLRPWQEAVVSYLAVRAGRTDAESA